MVLIIVSIPEITDSILRANNNPRTVPTKIPVRKIFLEPNLYNKIAVKGRQHIKTKFNWLFIGKQYEDLMNKVIKNHKPIIKGNNANF